MSVVAKIKEELAAFQAKREALVAQLRTEFPTLIAPILSESKRIETIGWRQYTPYFNDGDECTFGVHQDDLLINGEDEYGDGLEWIREKVWAFGKYDTNPNADQEELVVLKNIKEVLQSIPDDFYKDLFGDHAIVTINKNGTIEVDDYDHD